MLQYIKYFALLFVDDLMLWQFISSTVFALAAFRVESEKLLSFLCLFVHIYCSKFAKDQPMIAV